ncbi:MAG: FtsX-like permease family protein [Phenylobacterium sp.]|uniref:ABC transporter permease n=1 Tax=Phenylobacterium sp. TaxID=1871053 RepID=UPI0025EA2E92|nr:ABC transporter permease [Phenylobacterium sp.]MBI1198838.1 FtsX-like permease family protein [Phenylobacterium sp.]
MWGNYALSLYRTLTRHRLYAALNTLGLALGIAVCLILLLVVRFENSFDRWVPDAERIVRVNEWFSFPGRPPSEDASTQAILLPALKQDFPQIEAGARIWAVKTIVRAGDRQSFEDLALTDPAIFDVFSLPFRSGNAATALPDLNSLVVSETMARKYFGTVDAVGRELTVVVDGAARTYRVTGVLKDLPPNSHLELGLIARFDLSVVPSMREFLSRWGSSMLYTYLKLRSPADIAAVQAALPDFIDRRAHDATSSLHHEVAQYRLIPLAGIHFRDAKTGAAFKPGADPLFIGALGVMGVVTLLVAVVNYISLATARAGMRAREVAVRKVMGATRRALVVQFVAESVVMALAAGLVAAALAELALPAVSAVLGEPIHLTYFGAGGAALPLVALCVAVGLLSGVYPALVLSGFRPAAVLASARTPGGGRSGARVREVLAVGQFAIAIGLMACAAVIFAQIQYLRNADVGFRRDGLIVIQGINDPAVSTNMRSMLDAFRRLPGVVSVTASDRRPAGEEDSNGNVSLVSNPKVEPILTRERVGEDYAQTYGLDLLAGRYLDMKHGLDDRASLSDEVYATRGVNIMINEAAARAFGFTQPSKIIGERVRLGRNRSGIEVFATIIGVVRDVRFASPRNPPAPQYYMQDSGLANTDAAANFAAAIRVSEPDMPAVTKRLETAWRTLAPGVPLRAETVDRALKPYYDPDARRGQLFAAGSALSTIIACLGLYGLAAFNTARRTKEIGIRKTLGASTADVLRLLVGEFLRPVLWANLIAWPVAWFVMRSWLSGFDQRIDLNPVYFLAPSLAAILVAVVTVADQTIRVARAEPSRALRYE